MYERFLSYLYGSELSKFKLLDGNRFLSYLYGSELGRGSSITVGDVSKLPIR